jgi:hypothetical protein
VKQTIGGSRLKDFLRWVAGEEEMERREATLLKKINNIVPTHQVEDLPNVKLEK